MACHDLALPPHAHDMARKGLRQASTAAAAPAASRSDSNSAQAAAAQEPDRQADDTMAQERVKMLQFMAKVEQRLAQREAEAEERQAREAEDRSEARAQIELLPGPDRHAQAPRARPAAHVRSDGPDRKGNRLGNAMRDRDRETGPGGALKTHYSRKVRVPTASRRK